MIQDDNKIIHLYLLNKCTHNCKYCCNKQYDINEVPVVSKEELSYADTLCLTGGEPFLLGDSVIELAIKTRMDFPNIKNIYIYTCGDSLYEYLSSEGRLFKLMPLDGVSIAPKNKHDVECLEKLLENDEYWNEIGQLSSNRLYVFPNVQKEVCALLKKYTHKFKSFTIFDREWQKEFVAQSGIFRRIPKLMDTLVGIKKEIVL